MKKNNYLDLARLDEERRKSGLSVFAFSLTIKDELCDPENWSLCKFDIDQHPLAFFAIWFRFFFDNSDGGDFRNCFRKCHSFDIPNEYTFLNKIWSDKFHSTLDDDTFKSQCWLVSRKGQTDQGTEAGKTSELWRGLRLCLQKNREDRFKRDSYEDDCTLPAYKKVPRFLQILIDDYNRNREKGNGRDFAEFINVLKGDSSANEDDWYNRKVCFDSNKEPCSLLQKCNEVFNTDADIDLFLYHQPDTTDAYFIIGVDHIRKDVPQIKINGENRKYRPQYHSFYAQKLNTGDKYSFNGYTDTCPPANGIPSSYVCYQNNKKDERGNWWKPCSIIPYGKEKVLILLPEECDNEWQKELEKQGIRANFETRKIKFCDTFRSICVIEIVSRPAHSVNLKLEWLDIAFSGKTPDIGIEQGTLGDILPDEHYDAVCCSDSILELSCKNTEIGDNICWCYNNVEKNEERVEIPLNNESAVSVLSIICTIERNKDKYRRSLSVLVISPEIKETILNNRKGKSDDWTVEREKDTDLIIQDRLQQVNRKNIIYKNHAYSVFTEDTNFFFWFRNDLTGENLIGEKDFSAAELQDWQLCTPAQDEYLDIYILDQLQTRVSIKINLTCAAEKYKYISLAAILNDYMRSQDYVFNPAESEKKCEIYYNGEHLFTADSRPVTPDLCQDTQEHWGVYIPKPQKILISWFSDSDIESPEFKEFEKDDLAEYPKFVSLETWFNNKIFSEDHGEQFLALYFGGSLAKIKKGCSLGSHIRSASRLKKIKDGVKNILEFYGTADIRYYQDAWLPNLRNSKFCQISRLMNAEAHTPMDMDKYFSFWKKNLSKGYERISQIMHYMLEDGYNFLAEPEWFFQKINKNKELFIDNLDKKTLSPGKGLCAALIGQQHIDAYDPLSKGEVRELTRLCSSKKLIKDLEIYAICKGTWNQRLYRYPMYSAEKGRGHSVCINTYCHELGYADVLPMENVSDKDFIFYPRVHYITKKKGASWLTDSTNYLFEKFDIDKKRFAEQKVEYDVSSDLTFLVRDDRTARLFDIAGKMLNSERLTPCVKELVSAIIEHFTSDDCCEEYKKECDYKIIVLTGLILCMNLTICRSNTPENWFFNRESQDYKLVNDIVSDLFRERNGQDGAEEWRCLMRTMCAFMGLFSYFNF